MSDRATLIVIFRADQYGPGIENRVTLEGPYRQAFDPVDECNDPYIRMATNAKTTDEVRVIRKRRENYARVLADHLTTEILELMEANDTKNGYPKSQSSRSG